MMVYRGVIQGYMGFYRDYIGDNGKENGDYSSILDYIGVILGYWRINWTRRWNMKWKLG